GGWNKVKLYFMLGQPFETEEDVKAIPVLCDLIAREYYDAIPKSERNGRVSVQASTSFFVPKPFTPFQWAPMLHPEEFIRRAMMVKDGMREQLNRKSLSYHYHDDLQTELEGVFARGDRRVGKAILTAYQNGCMYDAWGDQMKYDVWMDAFEKCGISMDFYNYRERDIDELFPWDFIDIGVTKEYLKREWMRAKNGELTANCRQKCSGCGAMCYQGGVCFESKD
ncbi:MAG: B12-binding domain-containing radical SAM protein, partial [Lachnospiraceae bacterium]|nr:B12-binding domain-containing radical SAM protein [Lachnospiraceae bacterium]